MIGMSIAVVWIRESAGNTPLLRQCCQSVVTSACVQRKIANLAAPHLNSNGVRADSRL